MELELDDEEIEFLCNNNDLKIALERVGLINLNSKK